MAKASKEILESTTLRSILSQDKSSEASELELVMEDATVLELMQKHLGKKVGRIS